MCVDGVWRGTKVGTDDEEEEESGGEWVMRMR